jgi:hypothetical protein
MSLRPVNEAPTPEQHRRLLFSLRYVLPAAVCAAGVVIALAAGGLDTFGPDALAALVGAGGAIYLMNKIMRMGISGDGERDVEEAHRVFLDRYRAWPDELPPDWRSPDRHEDVATAVDRILDEQQHHHDLAA